MFKELFTEGKFNKWEKFAKTIQQAANTAKIKLDQIRVVTGQNGKSIEILNKDVKALEQLKSEVLVHFISSKMNITIHYGDGGTPMLSIYEN